MLSDMSLPYISVIIPVHKNQETLKELYSQLKEVFQKQQFSHEILFINDASPDDSASVISQFMESDPQIYTFRFAQNVGQHRAALKGLEMSQGSIIVIMDADLQDSPSAIPELIKNLKQPYEAVFAGRQGKYESPIRLLTSKIFKFLLARLCKIPKDAGMFVAMSREMVEALKKISMPTPFVVAMIGLTGLKIRSVPISREKRGLGKTAYTSFMRLRIGITTIYQVICIKQKTLHSLQQKKYYSKANHHSIYPENYPTYIQRQIEKTFEYLPMTPDQKVLEVGCGMGRFTIPLAEKQIQIEGLDISSSLIEKLNLYKPSIPTHCVDLLDLPTTLNGQYDVVIGFFVLHHLQDLKKAFDAISRLLKPQGRVLFIEPNPYNLLFYLQILFHPKMRWKNERYMLNMRRPLLTSAMREFTHFQMERFGFFPPFLHQKLGKIERKLEKIPICRPFLPFQVFYGEKN